MGCPTASAGFSFDASLAEWDVPAYTWLQKHAAALGLRQKLDGLAGGAVVFNPDGRVLVVQRASSDSMPDRWEIPGGAVDADDATILHGAARELREETGLVATHFTRLAAEGLDGDGALSRVFSNRDGSRWFCRFAFHVQVESCQHVRLDPAEHQAFVWASEEEIREQRLGSRRLVITHDSMRRLILEAFKSRRASGDASL